jgi:regulator of protease activity HflC (stomatin/prohibitin superfamily)
VDEGIVIAVLVALILLVLVTLSKSIRVVPQQRMDVVERLGRYQRTLKPGLNALVPYFDKVRQKVDMREQVVSFPPQPVITSDNLVVSIDTVLYYKVVDPVLVTYEIANFIQAIEQLTVTTLRNVIGSLDLEKALTSRDQINQHLSGVLDETTGRWGIKVTRVEIKAIEPPASIRDSMEKQMRAERDRRAAILNAEGQKQAQILTAEGEKQAMVLRADGDRQSRILEADGQAKAIATVFGAIHAANPDSKVMAYQYLQALPHIAQGSANKVWVVPVELTRALEGIGSALGGLGLSDPGPVGAGTAGQGSGGAGPAGTGEVSAPAGRPGDAVAGDPGATAEAIAAAEAAAATAAEAAAEAAAETAAPPRALPTAGGPAASTLDADARRTPDTPGA